MEKSNTLFEKVIREEIDFSEAPFCAIGKSTVCDGQGLFALKQFEPGEVIADYNITSNKWIECNFESMPKQYKNMCWWVGKTTDVCLLASSESVFMRVNHSNKPNADWLPLQKVLKANTLIRSGEEIVYDYTKEIAPSSVKDNPPSWV